MKRTNTLDSVNNRNMVWDKTANSGKGEWVNQTQSDTSSVVVLNRILTEMQNTVEALNTTTTQFSQLLKKSNETYILMENMRLQIMLSNQLLLKMADIFHLFIGEGVRVDEIEDITEFM